jgi:glucose dehydrogenase
LIVTPGNVGIWNWNGVKIWSFDTEVTFNPTMIMQVGNRIVSSDGTGAIDEFYVGDINLIEE